MVEPLKIENDAPSLEPLARAVHALNEIEKHLIDLRPLRDAFRRINELHGRVSNLQQSLNYAVEVLKWIAENSEDQAVKNVALEALGRRSECREGQRK